MSSDQPPSDDGNGERRSPSSPSSTKANAPGPDAGDTGAKKADQNQENPTVQPPKAAKKKSGNAKAAKRKKATEKKPSDAIEPKNEEPKRSAGILIGVFAFAILAMLIAIGWYAISAAIEEREERREQAAEDSAERREAATRPSRVIGATIEKGETEAPVGVYLPIELPREPGICIDWWELHALDRGLVEGRTDAGEPYTGTRSHTYTAFFTSRVDQPIPFGYHIYRKPCSTSE